uniref:Holocytochrome c-type synthase n=1 Tax=Branchiostoma floridae TaxID=7739 RepID=C3XVJ2_BRAFL|eukprot:XP_002612109.1 hypothetical protein BRAFLDRAFT_108880 [Branchiostoma floridae]
MGLICISEVVCCLDLGLRNVRKPFDHAWAPCWMITWMTRTQNGTSKVQPPACGFKCAVLSPFCESLSDVAKALALTMAVCSEHTGCAEIGYLASGTYELPFDRHDWIVDRCGKQVRYIIDYYDCCFPTPQVRYIIDFYDCCFPTPQVRYIIDYYDCCFPTPQVRYIIDFYDCCFPTPQVRYIIDYYDCCLPTPQVRYIIDYYDCCFPTPQVRYIIDYYDCCFPTPQVRYIIDYSDGGSVKENFQFTILDCPICPGHLSALRYKVMGNRRLEPKVTYALRRPPTSGRLIPRKAEKLTEGWVGGSLQAPDVVGGRPDE